MFSKNRDRLLAHEVVEAFFTKVMTTADKQGLLSKEHFSVDGTLIQQHRPHVSGPCLSRPVGSQEVQTCFKNLSKRLVDKRFEVNFNNLLERTVRYLGIEVDDALEIAEQTEV